MAFLTRSPVALLAALLIVQQAHAACKPVPPTWKLGQSTQITPGWPTENPPPTLAPGETGTYFTESGRVGSSTWMHEGVALIRNGCVVWSQIMGFADGTVSPPPVSDSPAPSTPRQ